MNYLYVFASRNESMAFSDYLRGHNIRTVLVSTPRECMTGCGLSVKVDGSMNNMAMRLLGSFKYKYTFKGIFRVENQGIRNIVTRVK